MESSMHLSELSSSFLSSRGSEKQQPKRSKMDTLTESMTKSMMKQSTRNDLFDSQYFNKNNEIDEVIDEIQLLVGKTHAYSKNSGTTADKSLTMIAKSPKKSVNQNSPGRSLREPYMFPLGEEAIPGQYEFFRTTPPRKIPTFSNIPT